MNEPIAYLNGRMVPASSAAISPFDAGFVQGASIAEQLRSFRGSLFRLEDHLGRLARSLEITGIAISEPLAQLASIAGELVEHNHALLDPADDLGLGIIVTPGGYPGYGASDTGPTILLHTYPLPFHLWHEKYTTGQALAIPATRQVPSVCWPAALKCRSRMHYYLADREAGAMFPGARALLLDLDGHVTEASTANVLVYRAGEGLVSPPHGKVLPGISLAEVTELALQMGVPSSQRDSTPEDLQTAQEILLTSTPMCLLPVVSLDGQRIGAGRPGDLFGRLIQAWSDLVGLDIVAQAQRFAARP